MTKYAHITHNGYRCFDPTTDKIYISCHVRFHENHFPFLVPITIKPTPSTSDPYISTYPLPTIYDDSPPPATTLPSSPQTPPATTLPPSLVPPTAVAPPFILYARSRWNRTNHATDLLSFSMTDAPTDTSKT